MTVPLWEKDETCRFNRPTPQAMIMSLRKARFKLSKEPKSDWSSGICWCLPEDETGWYLSRYIMAQLGKGHIWLSDWLRTHGHEVTDQTVRKARNAWIGWMINQLEQEING